MTEPTKSNPLNPPSGEPDDPPPDSSPAWQGKPSHGLTQLRQVMTDRGVSAREIHRATSCSRATIGDWMIAKTRPSGSARKKLKDLYGVEPAAWDRLIDGGQSSPAYAGQELVQVPGHGQKPEQVPLFTQPSTPDQKVEPNRGLRAAMQALETANRGLEDLSLPVTDIAKLLTAKLSAAKTVANLSGELDASELAAWKRGSEFRHLLNLAAESLKPWPDASRAYATALGVAHGEAALAEHQSDAAPVLCPGSPSRDALTTSLERLTAWLAAEGQDPVIGAKAADGLAYPLAGREREIAEEDPQLARDIAAALVRTVARLENSKIAHPPYQAYCLGVATRLDVEASRGDKMVAFRRDFGELAMSRAREAFGSDSR